MCTDRVWVNPCRVRFGSLGAGTRARPRATLSAAPEPRQPEVWVVGSGSGGDDRASRKLPGHRARSGGSDVARTRFRRRGVSELPTRDATRREPIHRRRLPPKLGHVPKEPPGRCAPLGPIAPGRPSASDLRERQVSRSSDGGLLQAARPARSGPGVSPGVRSGRNRPQGEGSASEPSRTELVNGVCRTIQR